MHYEDFTIRITSAGGDRYRMLVNTPMGSGEADLELAFRLQDLEGVLAGVSETVRGTAMRDLEAVADAEPAGPGQAGAFGVELYRSIFRDTVQSMLDQCLGAVRQKPDTGLRIRLEMDLRSGRMSDVASLPWELMRRDLSEAPLSVSKRTTLVRAFDVMRPAEPIPFSPPLRVLVIVSNPGGTAALDLAEEEKRIRATWGKMEDVEVRFVKPTIDAVLDICAAEDFHVIHYMGHGDFDPVSGQGLLFLERPDGSPDPLSADRLRAIFQDESDTLRLVFLNACKTAVSTERKGLDPFAGIATMLLDVGVPAVVAMQFPISDDAAITFADTFYRRIVGGYPVDAAVAEGRKALFVEGNRRMEWATPVLFMRSKDGVIFKHVVEPIQPPEPAPVVPPPPAPTPVAPQPLVGGGAAGGGGKKTWWMAGAGAVVVAAGVLLWTLLRPPPVPFVSELRLLDAPDSIYEGGESDAALRAVADDLVYDGLLLADLFPASLDRIEARSDSSIEAEFDEATGLIVVRGVRAGMASLWAVAFDPDGDSIVAEPRTFPVRVAPASILAAVDALEQVRRTDAGEADDAAVIEAYDGVHAEHASALQAAGRLDSLNARITALRGLAALRDSITTQAAREDVTLGEKRALYTSYIERSTALRRTHGQAHAAVAEQVTALDATIAAGGRVARISVCGRLSGGYCPEASATSALPTGRTVYATVWYIRAENFTLRWFRDGQPVDSETRTAGNNPAGYRVNFQRDVDAAGAWEVRVFNRAGNFVGRQRFTVQ